ncbi:MAG: hypothetical protein A3F83_09910 [Candidatus Glassbacteria bacterium RIFCSPLOWO2_12_FULL_58_11]|uniref:Uncharacterized protein n=1 Tax=Candidatus Glassbacteria bacterium RIFCSPLOWO2_12_FULL_58_11 TaxID=1817867 RepID=A0A1F5YZ73_9BACT|nr:MAG: hypothetical protein A3F83_09910 [Candidatus Glassbacteria bacterium RIFCSPLOWO2_12_FULL_58_11]
MTRILSLISLLFVFLFGWLSCAREHTLLELAVDELAPGGRQLLYYPVDGQTAGVNPPGFTWPAAKGASGYCFVLLTRSEQARTVVQLDSLRSTVAVLQAPLEPGAYNWYVVYRDSTGKFFARTGLRSFKVEEGTPELVLPDVSVMTAELKNVRPRIFLSPGNLTRIKDAAGKGELPFWELTCRLADLALEEPLYPEPAPYKNGEFEVGEWRRIYTPGKVGSAHAVRLALLYRVTGDKKYLEGAKKWLLHLATWDPDGITSYNLPLPDGSTGNDEAGMPMLERMSIAYDWIADELDPAEKQAVLDCLKRRANQILDLYNRLDFISNPWSNHQVRVLAFLGFAGLSLAGDLPDAEKWLDYVLRCYLTSYPTWGSDPGGWAQGLSYWAAYCGWHANFLDALRQATGFNLYDKPFFRNNGYFAVLFHPPYAKRGGFGDGGESAPNMPEKLLVQKYAAATHDPVLLWQSENIQPSEAISARLQVLPGQKDWKEWFMEDVAFDISSVPADLTPSSPAGLPGSKWLPDIGWVAMHSALGDADKDVWALFKSSRYGSFSHSHADQNSFQLNAYGEPLLIDSGYYPWFSSPHHNLWSRQTWAHNAILVNGWGEASQSMEAAGRIERFSADGRLTLTTGEASAAYNVPMDQETIDQWKEFIKQPLPEQGPAVKLARRSLAFSSSVERPWLAVHDYFVTEDPATFDYALHALSKMEPDEKNLSLLVKQGQARLAVYLMSDCGLTFSQTDKFPKDPEERYLGAPNQWHFRATTAEPRDRARFLVLCVPYRDGETPPPVKTLDLGEVRGFELEGEKILAWWGENETGGLEGYGEGRPGRMFIDLKDKGEIKKYLCE